MNQHQLNNPLFEHNWKLYPLYEWWRYLLGIIQSNSQVNPYPSRHPHRLPHYFGEMEGNLVKIRKQYTEQQENYWLNLKNLMS